MRKQERKYMFNTLFLMGYKSYHTVFQSMAAKGWMIEHIGMLRIRYRKTSPKNLVFSVCMFDERSALSPTSQSELSFFQELCEESGWTYVTSSEQYQVYCSESLDTLPLHSDSSIEFSYLLKKLKWPLISTHLLLLFFNYLALKTYLAFSYHYLESMAQLTILALGVFMVPFQLALIVIQLNWYLTNRRRMKEEMPLFFYSTKASKYFLSSYYIWSIIFLGIFLANLFYFTFQDTIRYLLPFGGSLIGFTLRKRLDKRKLTDTQLTVLVFSLLFILLFGPSFLNALPRPRPNLQQVLTLADVGITETPFFFDQTTGSPFFNDCLDYVEFSQEHRIQTFLLAFKQEPIYEYYLNAFLADYPDREPFGDAWESTKGYYLSTQKDELVILDNLRLIKLSGSPDFLDPVIISTVKMKYQLP